jgi:hypothetical protein
MCPACLTAAAWLATGATSAGGLIGFLAVKLRAKDAGLSGEIGVPRKSAKARSLAQPDPKQSAH